MSTTGVSPAIVIDSVRSPIGMSTLMVMTPEPATSTPSRLTGENPLSVNVAVYDREPAGESIGKRCLTRRTTSALSDLDESAHRRRHLTQHSVAFADSRC